MKKILSLLLAMLIAAAMVTAAGSVSAATDAKVHLVVKNDTYPQSEGAAWDGTIVDQWVSLNEEDSVETVIQSALTALNIPYNFNSWGYLSEIDGLAEYSYNGSGGWMTTLNDWFTNEGSTAYTYANGKLQNNDEIAVMYSCSWGADIGSLWGDSTTTLKALTVDGAAMDKDFDASVGEYTMTLDMSKATEDEVCAVKVTPEALNKNYQVRVYKNTYTPDQDGSECKKSQPISLSDGDKVYIGIGNENWPTMNDKATETVYVLTASAPAVGDVNCDGTINIADATLIQKSIANIYTFSAAQNKLADINHDKAVDIADVTALQRSIAGLSA